MTVFIEMVCIHDQERTNQNAQIELLVTYKVWYFLYHCPGNFPLCR